MMRLVPTKQVDYFNSLDTGLQAIMRSEAVPDSWESFQIVHTLRIRSAAMGGLTIPLLRVSYADKSSYPVEVRDLLSSINFTVENEAELINTLRSIFRSKETVNALQNMISQTK